MALTDKASEAAPASPPQTESRIPGSNTDSTTVAQKHQDPKDEEKSDASPASSLRSESLSVHEVSEITDAKSEDVHDSLPPRDPEKGEAPSTPGANDDNAAAEAPLHSIFPKSTKIFIVCMTVVASIFSPFSNFAYVPAVTSLARDLGVSLTDINLTFTSYQIMQGVAPLFFGDMADQAGRRPVYLLTFVIYLGANVGLALQTNFAALIVLRALQSTGSSATIAVGNGVVADIVTAAERGAYVGWVQSGIQLAPALAPVLGGILTQFLGWRSVFWFLVISSGVFILSYALLVPETGRKIVGNGSIPPHGINRPLLRIFTPPRSQPRTDPPKSQRPQRRCHVPNPIPALKVVLEKDVGIVLLFVSLLFTCFYCIIVTFPDVLEHTYGFSELQVGLCYIPFSVGAVAGSILCGKILDWRFRQVARALGVSTDKKRGNELRAFPIEKARLSVIWVPTFVSAATLVAWGWILAAGVHIAVPLIVMFISGGCMSGAMAVMSTLLVDLYPHSPATVSSSLNICRCLMSAAGTAVVQFIINAWGLGWTYTFLGLLVVVCAPMLWVVQRWGPRWREERAVRVERREERRKREKEGQAGI